MRRPRRFPDDYDDDDDDDFDVALRVRPLSAYAESRSADRPAVRWIEHPEWRSIAELTIQQTTPTRPKIEVTPL